MEDVGDTFMLWYTSANVCLIWYKYECVSLELPFTPFEETAPDTASSAGSYPELINHSD